MNRTRSHILALDQGTTSSRDPALQHRDHCAGCSVPRRVGRGGGLENQAEISKQWKADRRFKPSMKPATRKALVSGWNNALSRTQC